jgi:hypothetical protein
LKFIIGIFILTGLVGCNPSSSSSPPKIDTAVVSPTPNQGFTGYIYAAYGGPAVLCGTETCTPAPPWRAPMQDIRVVVVDVDMKEVLAETVSHNDGSYKVSVAPGTYRVCLQFETGRTCSRADTVHPNKYIVEDFDVGQG